MKPSKWEGQTHSIARWLAKLAEEHGEVGAELSKNHPITVPDYQRAISELEHVELIARCFREDLERRLA